MFQAFCESHGGQAGAGNDYWGSGHVEGNRNEASSDTSLFRSISRIVVVASRAHQSAEYTILLVAPGSELPPLYSSSFR